MQNTMTQFKEFALPKETNVKAIVLAGLAVLTIFLTLYVYFVGKIVFDVVAQRSSESSISASQSAISALDAKYYSMIQTVTLADASTIGLFESRDTVYASRVTSTDTAFLTN